METHDENKILAQRVQKVLEAKGFRDLILEVVENSGEYIDGYRFVRLNLVGGELPTPYTTFNSGYRYQIDKVPNRMETNAELERYISEILAENGYKGVACRVIENSGEYIGSYRFVRLRLDCGNLRTPYSICSRGYRFCIER